MSRVKDQKKVDVELDRLFDVLYAAQSEGNASYSKVSAQAMFSLLSSINELNVQVLPHIAKALRAVLSS
ncbi:MAG: hypothetical protein ACOCXP_04420 [Candidatus Dojkabacteria bacterium]